MVCRRGVLAVAVLFAGGVVGCSDDGAPAPPPAGTPTAGPPTTSSVARVVPGFDPPLGFADEGVEIVSLPGQGSGASVFLYQVHDGVVYFVLGSQLEARDLATGSPVWSRAVAEHGTPIPVAPVVAQANGRAQIFLTFQHTVRGSGTTQDRRVLRVASVAAADGAPIWARDIDQLPEHLLRHINRLGVAAANDNHVLVSSVQLTQPSSSDEVAGFTAVLDARTGAVRWQNLELWSFALTGDIVGGALVQPRGFNSDHTLAGRSATDGAVVWTHPEQVHEGGLDDGHALGPDLFFTHKGSRDSLVIDVRTGKVLLDHDLGLRDNPFDDCYFDGRDTIVCDGFDDVDGARASGFDRTSGKLLWQLPDTAANRTAPRVYTARNGAVYGSVDDDGIILDARTGQDRVTDLQIIPTRVDRGFGLRIDFERDALLAHPATR